jgi:protein-tyrosine phosphatase
MDEIVPGLFIGTIYEAGPFTGLSISVLDYRAPFWPPHVEHIAVLDVARLEAGGDARALRPQLNAVASRIEAGLAAGRRVLVSCGQGIERAPLAAAWFLSKARGCSLEDAYAVIIRRRPQVEPRLEWIEWPGF